jgi:hypothetical protein
MTYMQRTNPLEPSFDSSDEAWVVEVLKADNLKLSNEQEVVPYGRARLNTVTRLLMWAMRIYVVLSLVLIVAQLYISLH